MKILLDTHMIIWALTDDPHLTDKARELILDSGNVIYYSIASIWEIALKNFKSPEKCPYNESVIDSLCHNAGFESLGIKLEHIEGVRYLSIDTKRALQNYDPFDRLLLAQAKSEDIRLLSHDSNFANYDEPCLLIV